MEWGVPPSELMQRLTSEDLTYLIAHNNLKADESRQRELDARAQANLQKRRS